MTSTLSPADVARLLAEPSVEVRAELAVKMAQEIDNARLTPDELAIAQDIARIMAQDVAETVRRALAESLRRAVHLPRDVALRLANDVEAVALPILSDSPALSEADLIAILRHADRPRQQAIASRDDVSEPLAEVLIAGADESAVVALLRNQAARIAEPSLHRAVDRFASQRGGEDRHGAPRQPAGDRRRAPRRPGFRGTARATCCRTTPCRPRVAADLVLQSRERAIIGLSLRASRHELETLIRQMQRHQRLTPSLILRALCMGDLAFFETALAVRARVPAENAQVLVHDAGGNGLASLYRKAGLPESLLPLFRIAVDAVNSTGPGRRRARLRTLPRPRHHPHPVAVRGLRADDLDYLVSKLGDMLTPA